MMSIYLSNEEKALFSKNRGAAPLNYFYWALYRRVNERAAAPGLMNAQTTVEWWHATQEFVTDAAMLYALDGDATVGAWLRDAVLSVVRRPVDDWVGPFFRDHDSKPPVGHLETAHLSMAVASTYDLAPGIFSPAETAEIENCLREVALPMCTRWLDRTAHINNWRCVLVYGLAAAAVVLKDEPAVQRALAEYKTCVQLFQEDGSYGESLQYASYAAAALMLTFESLVRYTPALLNEISPATYALSVHWMAQSLFYRKPLSGWGQNPMPRSANFNDSAAVFRPSGDLLLHIAVRVKDSMPAEAGMARWLFDTLYAPDSSRGPSDRMTFGFSNHFGFLTMALLAQAPAAQPREQTEPLLTRFSSGDAFARDAWDGNTILAVRTASDPLAAPGHLHGDINSFILVHNQERLLLDPGHSCYRNLIRELDIASQSHNTCTFSVEPEAGARRPEDLLSARKLQQRTEFHRSFANNQPGPLVDRGGKFLLAAEKDTVKVIASDAAGLYGEPLSVFQRFWLLAGPHVLFVVDHIEADQPVRTTWNWLLNNRDGGLELKTVRPDRIVVRRGDAGLKLFHLGGGNMQGPVYAHVHDAYHPLPAQSSEGKPGSGMLMRFQERVAAVSRTVVHAIVMADYGGIGSWHLRQVDGLPAIEGPGGSSLWVLKIDENPLRISLREARSGAAIEIAATNRVWALK
jgi:hypothetical protein